MADQIKQIKDFASRDNFGDDDLLLVQSSGVTYSLPGSALKQYAAAAAAEEADRAEAAAAVTAHPPQANEATGYWQTWNPETGQYEDTAIKAEGPVGPQGETITDIQRTSGTGAAGTSDTYTITLSSGVTFTFTVYNGADGTGAGDMMKSIYDPNNKNTDIFAYVDNAIGAALEASY